ncbi:hypothetical protein MKZ38_003639 [Zalerion maritima]|uniref:BTB domain-containing protein n=1 Tax=Zalerion maritima TaxID=339359 RepID=A0AAD5RME7_9PEZI|nr:hypothetical protein MKZ38_003639 [Zalerion maritima]
MVGIAVYVLLPFHPVTTTTWEISDEPSRWVANGIPMGLRPYTNIIDGVNERTLGAEIIHVAVGSEQREFSIHRKLLESSGDYFTDIIVAALPPQKASDFFSTTTGFVPGSRSHLSRQREWTTDAFTIWLPAESPTMFELFVLWLYQRSTGLSRLVDEATSFGGIGSWPGRGGNGKVIAQTCRALNLHWNLARLHVFAAKADIEELQDVALDCLQDVFFRCDWDITPNFVRVVYERCDPDHAFRLRKWTVAMMAWTLATKDVDLESLCPGMTQPPPAQQSFISTIARRFGILIGDTPDLLRDFSDHVSKLSKIRGDASSKNPSIRLPSNALKSDGRQYGFRMCSFHSHRRDVGQGTCPHRLGIASMNPAASTTRGFSGPWSDGKGGARFGSSAGSSRSRRTNAGEFGSDSSSSSSDIERLFPCLATPGPLVRFGSESESED